MVATLTSLRIRNLALVEDLEWHLAPGFTAVTGETGSGKSIILGALKLILGERADKSLIRTGSDQCTVEALFEITDEGRLARLNPWLEEQGVEPCDGGQLIIKRSLSRGGANRQFINASATTLAVLHALGDTLIDLHGPHDHQSLLSSEKQLDLLDAYAGSTGQRRDYEAAWSALNALIAEHTGLAASEAALERELDLLRHQVREIEEADLREEEEADLLARYRLAGNSQRLTELVGGITARLADDEASALGALTDLTRLLRELEKLDPEAGADFTRAHTNALAELEELNRSLQHYGSRLESDPARLAELEERVSQLETLKRKYGPNLSDVIAFGQQAAGRLRKIEGRDAELAGLARRIDEQRAELRKKGEALTRLRAKAAPKLATNVRNQLCDLGFQKSDFQIALQPFDAPGPHGMEAVEYLFAPNPGEPAQPLKAIASSGEISRVMLALKSALAGQDHIALLVFDEIDANVGGEIAHTVGAKMRSLGERHQVLCITHLPQVASSAAAQFVVRKAYTDGRTISELTAVEGPSREEEIARMLGGKTQSALAHARELLRERK